MGILDTPAVQPLRAAANAVPTSPTSPVAIAGNGQATVAWTNPKAGFPITGHTVTASPGGATATVAWPAATAAVTGLTNGTAYTFTVKANNAVGSSVASAATGSVTPSADPGALSIQGCAAWWKADALTGYSDGQSVATVPDSSGNGFNATQPVSPYTQSAPTYKASWTNSKPALTFNGSNMSLITTLTQAAIGSKCTIFVACDVTAFNGDMRLISNQSSTADSVNSLIDTNASAWRAIFAGGQANTPAATLNTPTVLTITAPGYEYVSGTKSTAAHITASPATTNPWWIGAVAANKNYPGRVAEVIFYSRVLTDAERHQVEAYLGTKYAITMAVQ